MRCINPKHNDRDSIKFNVKIIIGLRWYLVRMQARNAYVFNTLPSSADAGGYYAPLKQNKTGFSVSLPHLMTYALGLF